MSTLDASDIIADWTVKLQAAVQAHPAVKFNGKVRLAAWLAESARDQAERMFLVLDATPVEERDLGWAEGFVRDSGMELLIAWQAAMDLLHVGPEPWAKDAADEAVKVYHGRLDELAPGLHAGGRA